MTTDCWAAAVPMQGFPPPLRGRDREGGKLQAPALATTPLPNPPPQGGREQSGVRGGNPNISAGHAW
jgi:hypothetical protein